MKLRVKQDYRELRKNEYPSLGDQMDAMWKGGAALEEMAALVASVKAKYKKPSAESSNEQT